MPEATLIPIEEAAKLRGLAPRTLRRRIAAGELTLYRDGADRRKRLLNLAELEALTQPQPIKHRAEEVRPPAA